jgi:hypothetical protein
MQTYVRHTAEVGIIIIIIIIFCFYAVAGPVINIRKNGSKYEFVLDIFCCLIVKIMKHIIHSHWK